MGDFLDTIVEECETDLDSTKLILRTSGSTDRIVFELPIAANLERGDVLKFYLGQYHGGVGTLNQAYITHGDYFRAEIYKKGTKEPILFLNSKDMDMLTRIKNYVEKNISSEPEIKRTA